MRDRGPGAAVRRLTVVGAMLLAASGLTEEATAADKIVVAWPSAINIGLAPTTFAQELGYFKKEDIELDVVVLTGSGAFIPQLLNGQIFTVLGTPEPLVISRQPGKPNFDFRFIHNYQRNSMWEIAVLEQGDIRSIKDLAGKSIGVGGFQWGNVPQTRAILKYGGIDPASVNFVGVGVGVPGLEGLRRGDIQAINLYDYMHLNFEQLGTKLRRLPFPPEFTGISSHGFPVMNKTIKERPDLVGRFGRAISKGIVACNANVRGCLQAFTALYPDRAPPPGDTANVNRIIEQLDVRNRNLTMFRADEPKLWGAYSDKDWQATITGLHEGGQIESTDIKLDSLYTNQFVEEFNKFSADEVTREAKAYAPK